MVSDAFIFKIKVLDMDPDPYLEFKSESRNSVNADPIQIRIWNAAKSTNILKEVPVPGI